MPRARPPADAPPPDLRIAADRIAGSLRAGRHPSARMGPAVEPDDRRAYQPGDPLSRIDWRLLARADRLSIRLSRDEAQLDVVLALDASASMGFASLRRGVLARATERTPESKWRCAQRLAAAIALLTVRQGDRVGLALARQGAAPIVIPPRAGLDAAHALIGAIETIQPSGGASLVESLALLRAMPTASLVIAIGDALDEPAPLLRAVAGVRAAPRRRDALLLQTLAPDELDLSRLRAARLRDPEGRAVRRAAASDAPAYRVAIESHLAALSAGLASMGARAVVARTDTDPAETLRRAFVRRVLPPL